jgi:osmotically-inducible protein OsmY
MSAVRPAAVNDRAERRLRGSSFLALRNICCEYHEGILTLRGCLPTYYLKQVAQEVVAEVEGVEKVSNRIEVVAPMCWKPS